MEVKNPSPSIATPVAANLGGSGRANVGTLAWGSDNITFTTGAATTVTLPTTGTLSTLAGAETLTNKTISGPSATMDLLVKANNTNAGAVVIIGGLSGFEANYGALWCGVTPSVSNYTFQFDVQNDQLKIKKGNIIFEGPVLIGSGFPLILGNANATVANATLLAALNKTVDVKDVNGVVVHVAGY